MEWRIHMIRIVKAMVVSVLLSAVLVVAVAYVLYKTDFTSAWEQIFVVLIYLLPCLAGGWCMGRMEKKRKFLWGGIVGCIFFLLLLMAALLTPGVKEGLDVGERIRVLMICLLGGIAGGMLS